MILVQLTGILLSVRTPNISDLTSSITGAVKVVIDKQLRKPLITNSILKSIKNKQFMYKTHILSNEPAKITQYKKCFKN